MTEKPTYEELEKRVRDLAKIESEQQLVEEKLYEEMAFNQTLLQAAPVFFVAINSDGKTIMINETMLNSLGYQQEEVVGKDYMTTFVPKKDREVLTKTFNKLIRLNEPTLNENHILTKDGKEILVEWHGRSIFNKKGEFDYFISLGLDVTERKKAEEKLKENEEWYRSLIHRIQAAIVVHGADTKIIVCNLKAEKLLGLTQDQLVEKEAIDPEWHFIEANGSKMTHEQYPVNQVLSSRKPLRNYIAGINHPDTGDITWVHISADPVFDDKGEIQQILVTFMDISALKQAEGALQESQNILNITGQMAKIGGWELYPETMKVKWTDETYRIYELPKTVNPPLEEAINFWHPEDQPILRKAIQRALDEGIPYDLELRFITAKGKNLYARTKCNPVLRNGKVVKLQGFFHDITERKQAQEILKEIITKNPMSIQILDKEGCTLEVNPSYKSLFGSVPPPDYSIFNDHQLLQKGLGKLFEQLRNGETVHFPELYFNAHDSLSEFPDVPAWIRTIGFPLYGIGENPEKFVFMHENITERKKSGEALQESERKYRSLFHNAQVALFRTSIDGQLLGT